MIENTTQLTADQQHIVETFGELEMTDLTQAAFSLYTPPFSFHRGYIFDSDGNTVADQDGHSMVKDIVRIRGWGRIGYLDDAEALQDKIGELTALALTEYWNKHKGV